jgi:transmembrane sensor
MKGNEQIDKLIFLFFSGKLTLAGKEELWAWFQESDANRNYMLDRFNQWSIEKINTNKFDGKDGWKTFLQILVKEDKIRKRRKHYLRTAFIASAACILIGIGMIYYVRTMNPQNDIREFAQLSKIKFDMNSSQVKLILSSDSALTIASKAPSILYNNNQISIDNKDIANGSNEGDVSYNQLIIPYGHHSTLTLSDGSKIWLNAGTRLIYPDKFKGDNREIYVEGEIYLEVQHDADHPFIVKTQNMDVNVLGTHFDVRSYKEESLNRVVLVNGSVQVKEGSRFANLRPNEMYESYQNMPVVKHVDALRYVSWTKGLYAFNDEKLGNIFENLKRYYGVNIIYDRPSSLLLCSGKLDLKDDFYKVMKSISETAPIAFNTVDGTYRVHLK